MLPPGRHGSETPGCDRRPATSTPSPSSSTSRSDPDRWSGNVEPVAARRIGRETVQYVGNVATFYVAYRQAAKVAVAHGAEERES